MFSQQSFDSLSLDEKAFIYFDSGSSDVDSIGISTIDSLLKRSSELDTFLIRIFAHTDNVGAEEFNLKLSLARAQSVQAYLDPLVTGGGIEIAHFGEKIPINTNATDEEKAANRRVEIKLYEVKRLQWIFGKVVNDSTALPIPNALVRLHSKNYADSTYTNAEGDYKVSAPLNEGVGIDIIGIGQMPKLIFKKLTSAVASKPIIIRTTRIKVGKKFSLKQLYFVGAKAIILPTSRQAIPTLKEFMIKNAGTCIRIEGHINRPIGEDVAIGSQGYELSVARAKALHDILMNEANINKSRMHYLGKGNWRMVFPRAKGEFQARKNRRVEVIIASCKETENAVNDALSGNYNFFSSENK